MVSDINFLPFSYPAFLPQGRQEPALYVIYIIQAIYCITLKTDSYLTIFSNVLSTIICDAIDRPVIIFYSPIDKKNAMLWTMYSKNRANLLFLLLLTTLIETIKERDNQRDIQPLL